MNLPQVVLVFNVIALTKGSSVGATKDPPCSSNEKFLKDLRSMLTSYLGDTTMMNVLANLQAQKAQEGKQVKQIQQTQTDRGGAVFTRWGRIDCPPGNDLVYKGSSVTIKNQSNDTFLGDLRTLLTTMTTVLSNLQALHTQQALQVKQVPQAQEAQQSQPVGTGNKQDKATGGAVFTRWGRIDCPPGNDFVYRGYAAGNGHHTKAGPATILCLPERPIYANYTKGGQGGSYIFGTEYESSHTSPNFKAKHDHDVPCAVCRSQTRRSVIMVPARNECLPGWRLEYWGYLMGGHYNYAASEYLCVDVHATIAIGGHENKNGQMLYLVESVCGSLPCPPYQDYWELTCVVCSKK